VVTGLRVGGFCGGKGKKLEKGITVLKKKSINVTEGR